MKKKIVLILLSSVLIFSLSSCGSRTDNQEANKTKSENTDSVSENEEPEQAKETNDSKLSQSEWVEQHADEMEDGYEVVDSINIDSGDTKLEYVSHERYTLENGDDVLLVNFTFSNVSAGTTSLDAQYNFRAFQDGVEIDVYSTLLSEVEGDVNRGKEILDGASIDVTVGIAPSNWESPIKLRVDDVMLYDDIENMGSTYQQQEISLQ